MDHATLIFIAVLLLSPMGLVLFHAVAVRLVKMASHQKLVMLSVVLFNLPLLAVLWWRFSDKLDAATVIYALLVYHAFGYCYFHFFNLSETARRVKIVIGVHKGNVRNTEDLQEHYDYHNTIAVRLQRLEALGEISSSADGVYRLRRRILYTASLLINAIRSLLGFQ
jgi:hypothetical protein